MGGAGGVDGESGRGDEGQLCMIFFMQTLKKKKKKKNNSLS